MGKPIPYRVRRKFCTKSEQFPEVRTATVFVGTDCNS